MALTEKCTINIDNNPVKSFIGITIDQELGKPDHFILNCNRSALVGENELDTASISSLYSKVGKEITFQLDNIQSGGATKNFFFKGIITDIRANRDGNSNEVLIISGYSPEIILQGEPTRRSFENKTLRQVVEEVLQPYPQDVLSLSSDSQPRDTGVYPYIVQYDESNYNYIARLGTTFSEWFYYDGRKLVFGVPKNSPATELTHGINLSEVVVVSLIKPAKFHSGYHDYLQDKDISADSTDISIDENLTTQSRSLLSASANRFRESGYWNYYNSYSLQPDPINQVFKIREQNTASGSYRILGTTSEPLALGSNVHVYGRTKQKSKDDDLGEFQVNSCRHNFTSDLNYFSEFQASPGVLPIGPSSAEFNIKTFPESAVVTDNNDPEHLGRVKVRTSWQDNDHTTPWARIVAPHSGDSRGHYFIPEVGDEVLVDYEHGDPQKPIVIGSFYSTNHGPEQAWVTDKNDIKKIRTRSGHTVEFDDTSGSEKLSIYNGAGSSAGSNSNIISLTLNPVKITIESQGDIELKGKNIKLDAQGSLELHAASGVSIKTDSGDASLEGSQVSVKADASVKVSGATAEIDGTGQVKIQGAIVQIN